MKKILITGSAGFIGFHLAKKLLDEGFFVIGIDNLNDYYDRNLKLARNEILEKNKNFVFYKGNLVDFEFLDLVFKKENPDKICHLAAQAGVRYSIENSQAYVDSNLVGFTNLLEILRKYQKKSFVYASSSSVYGGNEKIPFSENDLVVNPVSFYAATKICNEILAKSYFNLYGIKSVGLRFFTVYGEFGRPDMAYFSFTKKIFENESIQVFNHGKMQRDFTYIGDVIFGIISALEKDFDCEIFNLGNQKTETLEYFIETLELLTGKKAKKELLPMQLGDIEKTYADISKSKKFLGYDPRTNLKDGLERFVHWFRDYYNY